MARETRKVRLIVGIITRRPELGVKQSRKFISCETIQFRPFGYALNALTALNALNALNALDCLEACCDIFCDMRHGCSNGRPNVLVVDLAHVPQTHLRGELLLPIQSCFERKGWDLGLANLGKTDLVTPCYTKLHQL